MINIFSKKNVYLILFFISGAAGLIYEILIFREFKLLFGITSYSVSLVLSVFLGGLGIGALAGGYICRFSTKYSSKIKLYILSEIIIGITAICLPVYFNIINNIYSNIDSSSMMIRLLLSLPGTIGLTFFLGMTLPIMVSVFFDEFKIFEHTSSKIGYIYGVNTLGASLGTLIPVFILLPIMGLRGSFICTGIINLSIAGLFYYINKNNMSQDNQTAQKYEIFNKPEVSISRETVIVFITGFVFISLEILWSRYLIFLVNSTIYSFSFMLTAILLGVGAGSIYIIRFNKKDQPISIFLMLGGLFSILPGIFYDKIVYYFPVAVSRVINIGVYPTMILLLFAVLIHLFPLSFFIGAVLPLCGYKYKNAGYGTGILYIFNIIGGVAGAIITTFIFIKIFSFEQMFIIYSTIIFIVGIIYFLKNRDTYIKDKRILVFLTSLFIFLYVIYLPGWNKNLFIYSANFAVLKNYQNLSFKKIFSGDKNIFKNLSFKDGRESTISVSTQLKNPKELFLQINGKTDAGYRDMNTMILLSEYPILFHKNPKNALVVGFGSGVSLGILKNYGIKDLSLVEIEPEVIKAAHYFKEWNHGIYNDKTINWVIDDARHYLIKNKKKYDIIVSEPSNPWISGVSNLFTKETMYLYKKRLNKDGVLSLWIPIYNFSKDELDTILNTIKSEFKYCRGFLINLDLIFICSNTNHSFSIEKAKQFLQEDKWKSYSRYIEINNWYELYRLAVIDNTGMERMIGKSTLNTDDNLNIELNLPLTIYNKKNKNITEDLLKDIFNNNINLNIPMDQSSDSAFYLPEADIYLPLPAKTWKVFEHRVQMNRKPFIINDKIEPVTTLKFFHSFMQPDKKLILKIESTTIDKNYNFDKLKKDVFSMFPPPHISIGGGLILDNDALYILNSSAGRDYPDRFIAAWHDKKTDLVNVMVFQSLNKNSYIDKDLPEILIEGIKR